MKDLLIVSSHFNEDLSWLTSQSKYDYMVYSKKPQEGLDQGVHYRKLEFVPNRGQDHSSYYKFIIDNYDSLPDFVAFCHGHNHSWHMNKTIIEAIDSYDDSEYFNLNNPYLRNIFHDHGCGDLSHINRWEDIKFICGKIGLDIPKYLEHSMCCQFVTKRECILRRPHSFYNNCYSYMMEQQDMDNVEAALVFEQLWYFILTGKSVEPELVFPNIIDERGWRRDDLKEKFGVL